MAVAASMPFDHVFFETITAFQKFCLSGYTWMFTAEVMSHHILSAWKCSQWY